MNSASSNDQSSPKSALSFFEDRDNADLNAGVDRLTQHFLHQEHISSDISLQELQQQFDPVNIPEDGMTEDDFLQQFEQQVLDHSINTGSPYFIGHMTSLLPNFVRPLAKLKVALNQNMVKLETANAATFYEKQVLAMLHKQLYQFSAQRYDNWIHDPAMSLGMVTSGGTIANLAALQCARAASLAPFADVEELGLHGALQKAGFSKSVVIVSELGHYSIKKSLALLGLGKSNLLSIKVDDEQKIDINALRRTLLRCQKDKIHVTALVGVAGTTECGSFDPLNEMAALAQMFGVHFHVDAAWGGALIFSNNNRALLNGIEKADSVTIDGHKQLYLPIGTGLVLFKDPLMAATISNEANYIIRANSHDLGRVAVEGSRSANVFYLQAGLKLLGKQGYGEILDGNIATTALMAQAIEKAPEFQLLTKPQSNIFLYRYVPEQLRTKSDWSEAERNRVDEINVQLQETQKGLGKASVSRTTLNQPSGQTVVALRVVIANPLTTLQHCQQVLQQQREIALTLE